MYGQPFGFQLFKQIHNITTKFINNVQTGQKHTRYSLNFDKIIHHLVTNNFHMPNVAISQASDNESKNRKNKDKNKNKNPVGEGEGPWEYLGINTSSTNILGKKIPRNKIPSINADGKRLCFHAMRFKKCLVNNCCFSQRLKTTQ